MVVSYHRYSENMPSVTIDTGRKSRTRQADAAGVDINAIMKKYEKTGVLPVQGREAFYADVSQMGDYRTALEQVRMANDAFMQLPAAVRSKFDNEPALFLDFCSDDSNRAEMVEMGLIEDETGIPPVVAAEPTPDPVVTP